MMYITFISVGLLLFVAPQSDARLSDHFVDWLNKNGYEGYGFPRDDVGGRSTGGKADDTDTVVNQPVILIHGLGMDCFDYEPTIEVLKVAGGYKNSEIYGTTWGTPNYLNASVYFTKDYVMFVRKFIEAVINYTGAPKIDVIGHSMGVILTRTAIKGGHQWDNEDYDVGYSLSPYIDTYIGVAGPNRGSNMCYKMKNFVKACNDRNGLYPGVMTGTEVVGQSELLQSLNGNARFEGDYIFSIFSTKDSVFGNENFVYCEYTCRVPGSDFDIIFTDPIYQHQSTLHLSAAAQMELIRDHKVPEEFKNWVIKS